MATRSVMIVKNEYPYLEDVSVEHTWFGGFAVQQKRRCYLSIHLNFLADSRYVLCKPLEISSASHISTGVALSAMSLKKYSKCMKMNIIVESAFQSSKIFVRDDGTKIGPFPELLTLQGRECKKTVKILSEGLRVQAYEFDGIIFPVPAFHISLFYDWLYINALCEESNRAVRDELINGGYNAFTNIATKSLNSQARSCAIFVSLHKLGLLNQVRDPETYFKLFRVGHEGEDYTLSDSWDNVQLLKKDSYIPLHTPVSQRINSDEVKEYYNSIFV